MESVSTNFSIVIIDELSTFTVGLDAIGYVYDISLQYPMLARFGAVPSPQFNPTFGTINAALTQFAVAPYLEQTLRVNRTELTTGLRLDYVFARGLRVTGGAVVRGLEQSDHDPVWTTLALE